jgi:signal peptidase I
MAPDPNGDILPDWEPDFGDWPADSDGMSYQRSPVGGQPDDFDDQVAGSAAAEGGRRREASAPLPDDDGYYDQFYDDDEDFDDDLVELRSTATRNALEWAVVLVGAVLVALVLRASLFQAFWIPSESMETTLLINDRVLVNKLSYHLHDIHRGDVVVFVRPENEPGDIRDLIKRVIGVPGDTVEARNDKLYVNGVEVIEPYLDETEQALVRSQGEKFIDDFGPVVVPEGQMFVMGDNRRHSFDSRSFGTVSEDRVVGRAFVLFWPLSRFGWL